MSPIPSSSKSYPHCFYYGSSSGSLNGSSYFSLNVIAIIGDARLRSLKIGLYVWYLIFGGVCLEKVVGNFGSLIAASLFGVSNLELFVVKLV